MLVTGLSLVDQHWGAIPPARYRWELNNCLFDKIDELNKLDFIVHGGDTFDMKEYTTADPFKELLTYVFDLLDRTERLGTIIVFIEGTRTHDSLQLDTLKLIFNTILKCDRIKFIKTVTKDDLCGLKVLYIPEEYVLDQDDYYKDYFNDHYDIIFGHGMIDKIWYVKKEKTGDMVQQTTAPVFNVDQLCNIGNYVYFGHIHEHKAYGPDKRFKYVGPSTVWEYDKEWDCGYYHLTYDTVSNVMDEEFIVNKNAQKLLTRSITISESVDINTLDKRLDDIIKENIERADGLRLVVNISESIDNFGGIKDYLISKIGTYRKMKLVLKILELEETIKNDQENNETEDTPETQRKSFFDDFKEPSAEQISEFIRFRKGKNIPIEYIKQLLEIS
jgi:DNA repair exonuclease SbcCD nuclease subunit